MKNFYHIFTITLYTYGVVQSFYMISPIMKSISSILGFFLFVEIFILTLYTSSKRYWKNLMTPEIFVILILLLIYSFYNFFLTNYSFYSSLFMLIKFFTVILLMCYISFSELPGVYIKRLLFLWNSLLIASILICKFLTGRFAYLSYYGGDEYFGYFQNAHMIGMGLVGLALFQFFCYIKEKNLIYFLFFVINSVLVYLFKVRTYLLALAVGLITYFILYNKISIRKKIIVFFVVSFAFIIILSNGIDLSFLMNRVNTVHENDSFLQSLSSGRTVFWMISLISFFSKSNIIQLFFGYGTGGSLMIISQELNQNIGSHNDWITILIECGIFGLLAYSFFYFKSFIIYSKFSEKINIIVLFVVHIICSIFNGTINYTYSSFIFFFVLLYVKITDKEAKQTKEIIFNENCVH